MTNLNKYENLTFEEATHIIYFNFSNDVRAFKSTMEDLMVGEHAPHKCIAPKWYDNYRDTISENKNDK